MKKYILSLALIIIGSTGFTQTIRIEFPAFAGKTFEFIIFQGSQNVKVYENDTIPPNGVVDIVIPQEYAPYTGMSRWLITNTAEGGGLDMAIPGHDFKVTCLSSQPDESNIKYEGFDAVNPLNKLNRSQQTIIDKYETMERAMYIYAPSHPLYKTFRTECVVQMKAFDRFQLKLKRDSSYHAKFLPIVNLSNGITSKLTDNQAVKAKAVNHFIVNELDYDVLYTSGHWTGTIQNWVQLQTQFYNSIEQFVNDFSIVSQKITEPKKYTDWVGKVTYYLTLMGKDDFIEAIAPLVISSKKITSYEGKTMQVYIKAMVGSQAPDITISKHIGAQEAHVHESSVLQSKDFAQAGFQKTLLVFFESGCGPCESMMQTLKGNYDSLKAKGIDVIAIASDLGEQVFKNTSAQFPWQRTYCDFHGKLGVNFVNYAVEATPTLFLVNQSGVIEKRFATIDELFKLLN